MGMGGRSAAPQHVIECLHRSIDERPMHNAIVFGRQRLTFAELGDAVQQCAEFLHSVIASPGLVGLRLGRTPEYVVAYLAVAALGGVVVPFDDDAPTEEVLSEARALGLVAILTNRKFAHLHGGAVIQVEGSDSRGGPIPWAVRGLAPLRPPALAQPVNPDAPLVLLRTSGSTWRPKRVMLTHRSALASSRAHRLSVGHGPDEVSLVALSMSYGYCHTTQLVAQIDAGGTLALLPGTFLPRTFGEAVWAAGATTTTLVPSMMTMLARAPDRKLADLASLRTIVFGGAPIRADILDNLRVRLPRAELIQTYGQTEAGPRITTLRADAAQMRPGSVGRAIPGMRIEIRSTENGESLPPCQTGEVVVCGDGVMSGYFDDAAATAEVLRDGWLHTGDLGWLDDAGFLWLSGRMRNLIITAGLNVVAEEIEAHLRQVPGVADAAVFGEPDELRGESIHAVIVRLGGAAPTERDVRTFLGPRMQPHKLPRRISFVSELPKTSNGKVDRVGLARLRIGGNDDR